MSGNPLLIVGLVHVHRMHAFTVVGPGRLAGLNVPFQQQFEIQRQIRIRTVHVRFPLPHHIRHLNHSIAATEAILEAIYYQRSY